MDTPYDIVTLAIVASTQDDARNRVAETGIATLVVADEQLAGRGRQGREWIQPDRGMYASLAFKTGWETPERTLVPLVAAVAMRRTIGESFGADVGLKWPNDLMVGDLKIGGILVEASGDTLVVGCGVNLWWGQPVGGSASLLSEDPGVEVPRRLAGRWAGSLFGILDSGAENWPRAEYEGASVTIGEEVRWDGGRGLATGIADDGALVVDRDGKRIELHSGEVHTHHDR